MTCCSTTCSTYKRTQFCEYVFFDVVFPQKPYIFFFSLLSIFLMISHANETWHTFYFITHRRCVADMNFCTQWPLFPIFSKEQQVVVVQYTKATTPHSSLNQQICGGMFMKNLVNMYCLHCVVQSKLQKSITKCKLLSQQHLRRFEKI